MADNKSDGAKLREHLDATAAKTKAELEALKKKGESSLSTAVDTVKQKYNDTVDGVKAFNEDHVHGKLADKTDKWAQDIADLTKRKNGLLEFGDHSYVEKDTAAKAIPVVAAAAAAGAALLLLKPIDWLMQKTFGLGKTIVTGGGYLSKIPIIGKVFEWLGDALEGIGKIASYGVVALAGIAAYSAFDKKAEAPSKSGAGRAVINAVTPVAAGLLPDAALRARPTPVAPKANAPVEPAPTATTTVTAPPEAPPPPATTVTTTISPDGTLTHSVTKPATPTATPEPTVPETPAPAPAVPKPITTASFLSKTGEVIGKTGTVIKTTAAASVSPALNVVGYWAAGQIQKDGERNIAAGHDTVGDVQVKAGKGLKVATAIPLTAKALELTGRAGAAMTQAAPTLAKITLVSRVAPILSKTAPVLETAAPVAGWLASKALGPAALIAGQISDVVNEQDPEMVNAQKIKAGIVSVAGTGAMWFSGSLTTGGSFAAAAPILAPVAVVAGVAYVGYAGVEVYRMSKNIEANQKATAETLQHLSEDKVGGIISFLGGSVTGKGVAGRKDMEQKLAAKGLKVEDFYRKTPAFEAIEAASKDENSRRAAWKKWQDEHTVTDANGKTTRPPAMMLDMSNLDKNLKLMEIIGEENRLNTAALNHLRPEADAVLFSRNSMLAHYLSDIQGPGAFFRGAIGRANSGDFKSPDDDERSERTPRIYQLSAAASFLSDEIKAHRAADEAKAKEKTGPTAAPAVPAPSVTATPSTTAAVTNSEPAPQKQPAPSSPEDRERALKERQAKLHASLSGPAPSAPTISAPSVPKDKPLPGQDISSIA